MTEKDNKNTVPQQIEVKKVFKNKNPKLARIIPGFVYAYLRRIIHQDYINYFLAKHGHKKDLEFVRAAIREFKVTINTRGEEHIPEQGVYIFVSNHPLGGFDGLVLMDIISRHFKKMKFLVNDILMNITPLTGLFIPINKHGKQGIEAARKIDETFQSDTQILTFPAGLVSRKIKGQIVDPVWHKNFITKAIQHRRDIIPVHMSGRNTDFFYNLANLRKFSGIKSNIEMLYLADETYKHQNKTIQVTFGQRIPWTTFDQSKSYAEWAKWVKEIVYGLAGVKSIPL